MRAANRPVVAVLVAVLAAVAVVAGACSGGEGDAGDDSTPAEDGELRGAVIEPAPDVSQVALPLAETGEPLTMRADPGELLVVYFGYTHCPDVCPLTMSDLGFVLEEELTPEQAARVDVAMATIDPGRDTPEIIEGYTASFVPDAHGLWTDDPDELRAAGDAFGVVFDVTEDDDGEVEVTHSGSLYVVDDEGNVVVQWLFGTTADDLAHDLRLLLESQTTDEAMEETTS